MAAGDLSIAIAISAVDNASEIIKQIGGAISQLVGGGALGGVATGAAAAAALVSVGVEASKAAGDFNQALTMLSTSAGESAANLKMVGDGMLQISTDTGTSTQQLTSAMYNIESGGQHGADGLHILQIAAEGAKTENADLTTVSKALMTVMTDYKLPAQDATGAMNGLIASVQNGRTTLQAMSAAMGQVLPNAAKLGISFPQVAGAMDTLTNAGVPAMQAAQNLSHVLTALEAPSKVAVKSMTDVGLSAQEVKDTLVNKGLPEAFQLIEDHVASKFPAGSVESETALKNIVGGLVGLKTAAALSGDALGKTEAATRAIAAAMGDASKGVMGWELVQQGFNFQMDRAKAAINAFMIVIGQQLLPLLTPIIAGFTSLVSSITSLASAGTSFNSILQAMGVSTTTFNAIMGQLNTTFGLVQTIVGQLASIFGTTFAIAIQLAGKVLGAFVNNDLAGTVGGLNGFLQSVSTVLGLIEDGLILFQANIDQICAGIVADFNAVVTSVTDFASGLATSFTTLASNAITWGTNLINGFATGVINGLNDLVTVVVQIMTEIENYLGFASPSKKGPGQNVNKWGLGLAQGIATGMLSGIPDLTDAAGNLMSVTEKAVTPGIASAATTTSTAAPLTTGLSQGMSSGAGAVKSGAAAVGDQLHTVCSTHAKDASKCASDTMTSGLGNSLKSGADKAAKGAAEVGKKTGDALTKALTDAKPKVAKAANDLAAAVAGALPAAMKIGSDGMAGLQNAANKLGLSLGASAAQIKAAYAALEPYIKAASAAIAAAWATVVKVFNEVKANIQAFITWATPGFNTLKTVITTAWTQIGIAFSNAKVLIQAVLQYMQPGLEELKKTLDGELRPAFDKLMQSIKPVTDMLKQFADDLKTSGANALTAENVYNTITSAWDKCVTAGKLLIIVIGNLTDSLSSFLAPVSKQISDTWNTQLKPAFTDLNKTIKDSGPLFDILGQMLKIVGALMGGTILSTIGGLAKGFGNLLAGAIKAAGGVIESFTGVVTFFTGFGQSIVDILQGNWQHLYTDWDNMWKGIKDIEKGSTDTLSGLLQASFGTLLGFFSGFSDSAKKYWTDLATYFHIDTGKMVADIEHFFKQLWTNLVGSSIIPDIVNDIKTWFNKLIDFVPTLMTKITKFFTDAWATIQKDVDTALKAINTAWTNFGPAVLKIVQDMWTKIQGVFQTAYTTYIKPALDGFTKQATTWATDLQKLFTTWGGNFMKMLGDGITGGLQGVKDAATKVADTIKSILGINSPAATGPLSGSNNWIPNLMKTLADQIKAGTPGIASAADAAASTLQLRLNAMELAAAKTANDVNAQNKFIVVETKTAADQVGATDSVMRNTSKDTMDAVATNTSKATLNMHDSVITVQRDQTIIDKVDDYVIAQAQSIQNQVVTSTTHANTQLADQTKVVVDWGKWAGGQITISDNMIDKWGTQLTKTVSQDVGWAGNQINISDKVIDTWWNNLSKTIAKDISSTQSSIDTSNKTITAAESSMTGQVKQAGTMASQANVYAGQSTVSAATSNTEAGLSSTFKSASQAYASGSASYAGTSGNYAGISVDGFTLSGAAATGSAQGASSSTQSSGISNSMLQTSNAAASGAVSAAAASTSSAGASTSAAGAASSASSASKGFMSSSLDSASGSKAASGFSNKAASDSKTYAGMAEASANQASKSSANAHSVGAQLSAYVAQLGATIGAQIAGLQASVASAASGMVAAAQSAAAAAAALLAHSKPKEGPMKDDDQWMHHFMDNLIRPIHDDIPRLARACRDIADTVGGAIGGGVPSPVAAGIPYTITTGHSIPITILPPPPPPPTSASQPPIIIHSHVDCDGREIGKCTTKYLQKEIHEQGGYKRR